MAHRLSLLLLALLPLMAAAQAPPEAHAAPRGKTLFFLAAGAAAATAADFWVSYHCEAHYPGCVEANPVLPHNHAAVDGLEASFTAAAIWDSWRERRRGHRSWPLPLAMVIAVHGVAVAWDLHVQARCAAGR